MRAPHLVLRAAVGTALFGAGAALGLAWHSARAGEPAPGFADAVARARDGVVGVRCLLHPAAVARDPEGRTAVTGSGVVIDGDGLVLTNQHLVAGAMMVVVELPCGARVEAEVAGSDALTDLAVLRLRERSRSPLRPLVFGDSSALRQADWVVALGNPFDFRHTVTAGLVSHVGRHLPQAGSRLTSAFLQFSAPVNPGSSGGPVLDRLGLVVGITSAKLSRGEGISFAVPSDTVRWVLQRMRESGGSVPRGYLGVGLDPRPQPDGVRVSSVARGEAAWEAGVRRDDVILRFDGRSTTQAEELYDWITQRQPGSSIGVTVRRGRSAPMELQVTLGSAEVDAAVEDAAPRSSASGRAQPGSEVVAGGEPGGSAGPP